MGFDVQLEAKQGALQQPSKKKRKTQDQAGTSFADTKSTYEEIRDEIVRNRRRELKETGFYVQLEEAKQGAMQPPSKKKRKTLGDASNSTESLRRSSRERRPVDYKDAEES